MTYFNRLPTRRRRLPAPPEDTPMIELLAPLSAMDPDATPVHNPLGNYTRKRKRKAAAQIDAPRAIELRAEGYSIDDIADALGVSTRSVERALAIERRGYRSFKR